MRVEPFPWGAIPAVSRDGIRDAARLRAWLGAHAPLAPLGRALGRILAADVTLGLASRALGTEDAVTGELDHGIFFELASPDGPTAIVLELEAALATEIVTRGLKRSPPSVVAPRAPSPNIVGATAAVLAAALRTCGSARPLRIVAAGTNAPRRHGVAPPRPNRDARRFVPLVCAVETAHFAARIAFPPDLPTAALGPLWDDEALASLGDAPMRLELVALASSLPRLEAASLRIGDVFVVGGPGVAASTSPTSPTPRVLWLVAARGEIGTRVELGPDGRLVLGGETAHFPWEYPQPRSDDAMNDPDSPGALVQAMGDLPLVVRVEVGSLEMRARDWAAVGPGDVLPLGLRVGEAVVLRAGGVELGRGELVDIEGEMGVRILERGTGEAR